MKTNKFWYFMAAAVMFTGMVTLTSCEKDEPVLPEVIESEVLDQGMDENVEVQSGTEGTSLSYESWILVKGITRAEFENRVSVTLNNKLNHISGELDVKDFNEGEPVLEFSTKAGESRKDGFVTVTDSILVCTVRYPDFSFDYELVYQVGVYDDGVTRQVMPYYTYENITDKGSVFSAPEKVNDNGREYEKRTLTHELEVTFNGEVYTVKAELVLYKGRTEDTLLSSKVVNEGSEIVSSTENSVTTLSFIEVEQEWSASGKKAFRVETEIDVKMSHSVDEYGNVLVSKWSMSDHLKHELVTDTVATDRRTEGNVEIVSYRMTYDVAFADEENENGALFTMHTTYDYEVPVYKDDVLTYEMPYEKLTDTAYEFFYIGSQWENTGNGVWRHPFKVEQLTYVGEPEYVSGGNDANGDGIDDVTGEPVDWYVEGAVKLSWVYNCELLWYGN